MSLVGTRCCGNSQRSCENSFSYWQCCQSSLNDENRSYRQSTEQLTVGTLEIRHVSSPLLEMEFETGHETEQVASNTAATYSDSDRSEGEGERAFDKRIPEKPTDLHHRPLRADGHTSTHPSREAVRTLYTVTLESHERTALKVLSKPNP